MRPCRSEGSKLARHFRMPRPSKLSIVVGGGVLCAVTAVSLTAATWPAASPAAFTSKATTAHLAIVNQQQQSAAKSASLATGAADVRSGKAAAASRVHEIQIAHMLATAARLHAAHLAVLAKRAEQARQAAAAAAARAAAAKAASAKAAAAKAAQQSSSTSSSSAG